MQTTTWFRDLDTRDADLAERARAGDVVALRELKDIYRQFAINWVERERWTGDMPALLEALDEALEYVVLHERGGGLHSRWLEMARHEATRVRLGLWRVA